MSGLIFIGGIHICISRYFLWDIQLFQRRILQFILLPLGGGWWGKRKAMAVNLVLGVLAAKHSRGGGGLAVHFTHNLLF